MPHHHPHGFIDDNQEVILIDNVEGNGLGRDVHRRRALHTAPDHVARLHGVRRPPDDLAVDRHVSVFNSPLHFGPRGILHEAGKVDIEPRFLVVPRRHLQFDERLLFFFHAGIRHVMVQFSACRPVINKKKRKAVRHSNRLKCNNLGGLPLEE